MAYFPRLAQAVRGVAPGLFLAQLCYWHGKQADPDGWIRKSAREMEAETGMSRREQDGARRVLRLLRVTHEQLRGVPATIEYRVDFDRLQELWNAGTVQTSCTDPPNQLHQNAKLDAPNVQTRCTETPNLYKVSETTTENTSETTQIVGEPLRGDDESAGRVNVPVHRRSHALPDTFTLTADRRTYAEAKGCTDTPEAFVAFVDHWVGNAKRKASWDATYRNWVRNSHGPHPRYPCLCRGGGPKGDGLSQSMRNVRAVAAKYRAEGRL